MSVLDTIDTIRNRIVNAAAESAFYLEHWGEEYALKNISKSVSPNPSLFFREVKKLKIKDLQECENIDLYRRGFGNWNYNLMLIPLYLVGFIDGEEELTTISGKTEKLKNIDMDARFGCIAAGFLKDQSEMKK